METIKKSLLVLSLLLVVIVAWVVSSVYFQNTNVEINPNASSYTANLNGTFDTTELESVMERSDQNTLPISADEFLDLIATD
jgi:lipopolysaccharide export system protein LptC